MRQNVFSWAVLVAIVGCGAKERPTALPEDADTRDLPPVDVAPLPDGEAPDLGGSDAAVPMDGAVTEGGVTDATADSGVDGARADAPRDVPADVFVSPLCGFTESQINRLAVRIAGCTGQPAQVLMEQYWRPETWEGEGVHARDCVALRCAASATTCQVALLDCLKYIVNPVGDAGTCSMTASCEGAGRRVLTRCDGARIIGDDCEATGRSCIASATQATCVQGGAETCTAGAAPRCVGSDYQQCIAGRYATVQRCGATQSACNAAAGGCVGTGAACMGAEVTCDGTRVGRCRNGRAQPIVCSDLTTGSTCRVVAGHVFCGTAGDCDPTTASPGGRCDGTSLLLCAGGRNYRYDCMVEGFSGCGTNGCTP